MIKQKRLVVYIPEIEHYKLKIALAIRGKTFAGWIRQLIKKEIKKHESKKSF
jgi:hypothetical protein